VEPLCRIALNWRTGDLSIRDHFRNALPDLGHSHFTAFVRAHLRHRPALIKAWEDYSADKRGSPSPFLSDRTVGFFEVLEGKAQSKDVRQYRDRANACADFIYREAVWVLERRRALAPPASSE
jgi:hypothetical protein